MSLKTLSWIVLAVIALGAVLLFNYWASYQLFSTLAYAGIVTAVLGLANLLFPFRFMGVRKRLVGALILVAGVALTFAALWWPASTVRVAQSANRLDEAMPEYQFFEKHSARIHARPEQVMQAVRESTFGDMKSLSTLLKIRGAALRAPTEGLRELQKKRVLDSFAEAGYLSEANDREIVIFGVWNARENRRPDVHTLEEFVAYGEQGALKMAYDFSVQDTGDGFCTITTETRVMAFDAATRGGMGRYWRLIVPGSGLLRRQWLDGIRRRAEGESL